MYCKHVRGQLLFAMFDFLPKEAKWKLRIHQNGMRVETGYELNEGMGELDDAVFSDFIGSPKTRRARCG
jgi:hypothetical protein